MRDKSKQPFISFGEALKKLRQKNNKSQAEVSGAVEVDLDRFAKFEAGELRPAEDTLLLIIQHFDLSDTEAVELWNLAGYPPNPGMPNYFVNDEFGDAKQTQTAYVTTEDVRIVYTDMIQVMVNNYGVIMNFMQGAGVNNQPLAVARVGMSKEHAKSIIEVLTKTLEQAEALDRKSTTPKRLSSGKPAQEK